MKTASLYGLSNKQFVGALSPHPGPLPWGEGGHDCHYVGKLKAFLPLPKGEGRGEGEETGQIHRRREIVKPNRSTFSITATTYNAQLTIRHVAGFTLIELVISAALMAMILGASYVCLNAAIAGKKVIEPRADVIQNARVAMAMISADLRSACPLSKDFEFLGMHRMIEDIQADNLDFATHNYMPRRAREADYCQISYFVEKDENSSDVSLYRRRNPTIALDPLSGGSRELVARGLRGVSFEYYDGWDWYDTWGELNPEKKERKSSLLEANLSGMPEAVRITLWFDPNPRSSPRKDADTADHSGPGLMFETTVRLNLAAASQSGFSGSSSTNNAAQPQDTAQPQPNQ